jgi:hypothetical protein
MPQAQFIPLFYVHILGNTVQYARLNWREISVHRQRTRRTHEVMTWILRDATSSSPCMKNSERYFFHFVPYHATSRCRQPRVTVHVVHGTASRDAGDVSRHPATVYPNMPHSQKRCNDTNKLPGRNTLYAPNMPTPYLCPSSTFMKWW